MSAEDDANVATMQAVSIAAKVAAGQSYSRQELVDALLSMRGVVISLAKAIDVQAAAQNALTTQQASMAASQAAQEKQFPTTIVSFINSDQRISKLHVGTGDPDGVVTGTKGDLFLRTDGGSGTTLYVSEDGGTAWKPK